MLRLGEHASEQIVKLNEALKDDEEMREEFTALDSASVQHADVVQLVKFVRKHSKQLERRGIDTRPYNLVTLLAGSKPVDDVTPHSFKSDEYDKSMRDIRNQADRNAYLKMVGSSLFPQDERGTKPVSVYKETKDELQVVTSVLASMLAVATAIWWAGGSMNPTYKTLLALFGAIGIAVVEASLYVIIQTRKEKVKEEMKRK